MNTNKVVFIRLFEYLNHKKYEKTPPIEARQLRILMHSIELVFNNKRNIPSTCPPSTHPPSTYPESPSKTKSKALLPIVG